jgi:hypothetical protein
MAKAMIWVKINQMIAPALTVEAEAPIPDHGETDEKPRPVPRVRRIKDSAAAVKAPPMTAGHEMPEEWVSFLTSKSGYLGSTGRGKVVCGMELAS